MSTRDRARGTIVCISLCLSLALILISTAAVEALDNGLALTPPMGWNSWNAFRGEIDEVKIRQIAEAMVSSGMKDAGYEYIILDDNWMANPARCRWELDCRSQALSKRYQGAGRLHPFFGIEDRDLW